MKSPAIISCSMLFLLVNSVHAFAFIISAFPAAVYDGDTASMDATLGLDNRFTVEDFEENYFVPGFSLTYQRPNALVAHQFIDTTHRQSWDGQRALYIVGGERLEDNGGVLITFDYPVTTFGFGLSNMQDTGWFLEVNGVRLCDDISALPQVHLSARQNGYLLVTAEPGEEIHSILLDREGVGDRVTLDHLVYLPPQRKPAPGSAGAETGKPRSVEYQLGRPN